MRGGDGDGESDGDLRESHDGDHPGFERHAGGGHDLAEHVDRDQGDESFADQADLAGFGFRPEDRADAYALDGVSVTVNGKPAYVYYISSTQINVLTPIDSALGSVGVQVSNGTGSSNVFTVTMLANSLGFFAFNSGQYAAAEHADGSYIGPTTLYPGLSTPAKPGETIVLYSNGFGETDPGDYTGAGGAEGNLPHNPVITLGALPTNVINAAVVSPGLYQLMWWCRQNAPDGDLALQASYNSFSTQPGVLLTVAH